MMQLRNRRITLAYGDLSVRLAALLARGGARAPGQLVHVLDVVLQDHRRLDRARAPARSARGPAVVAARVRGRLAAAGPAVADAAGQRRHLPGAGRRQPLRVPRDRHGVRPVPRGVRPGARPRRRRGGVVCLLGGDAARAGRPGPPRPQLDAHGEPAARGAAERPAPVLRGPVRHRPQGAGRADPGGQRADRGLRAAPGAGLRDGIAGPVQRPRHAQAGVPAVRAGPVVAGVAVLALRPGPVRGSWS